MREIINPQTTEQYGSVTYNMKWYQATVKIMSYNYIKANGHREGKWY